MSAAPEGLTARSQGAEAQPRWWMAAVLAAVGLVYLNALPGAFHYDDSHSIVENTAIRSLGHLPDYFTDSGAFSAEPGMAMYRPVVLVTYAANYALGGLQPVGYHLANLAIHLAVVALLGLLLGRLCRDARLGWWAALLYGLHPVHTQVVNYVSSRSESLAAAGVLAALYLGLAESGRSRLGPAAYAAGLLAKSTAVVLVPLVAVVRWGASRRRCLTDLWPYAAVTAAYVALIWADGFLPRSLGQDVRPWSHHLITQTKALAHYMHLVAMPVGLSVEPAFHVSRSWLEPAAASSALFVLSLAGLALAGLRRGVAAGLGVLWFLASLAVPFAVPLNVLVNEHRLYLPAAGVALAVAWLMRSRYAARRRALMPWAAVAAGLLAALTAQRNAVWATDLGLWEDAAARSPQAFRAHGNLGLARYEAGDLEGARQSLERALWLNGGYAKTWSNLGLVLEAQGALDRAVAAQARAVACRPDLVGARLSLVRLHLARGENDAAAAQLDTALGLQPASADAHVYAGRLYQARGDRPSAAAAYERALELEPESAAAWNNLGLLRQEQGDDRGARQALARAARADTAFTEARLNLDLLEARLSGREPLAAYEALLARYPDVARLWAAVGEEHLRRGRGGAAAEALSRAVDLAPGDVRSLGLLGGARRANGDLSGAIEAYRQAIGRVPSAALYINLASAHAAAGALDSARASLKAAIALDPSERRARAGLERLGAGSSP